MTRRVAALAFVLSISSALACSAESERTPAEATEVTKAAPAKSEVDTPVAADSKPEIDCDGPNAHEDPEKCGADPSVRPAWLNADLIAHTRVIQDGGAEISEGQMSWGVMLALDPAAFNVDSCIEHLRTQMSPHFPNLSDPEQGKGGRKTVTGKAGKQQVRIMCGVAAKSGLTAYIGLSSTN